MGFQPRGVLAGLSPPDIELHPLELAEIEAGVEARADAARAELDRLMTFDSSTAQTDHWLLPPSNAMRTTAVGVAARAEGIALALSVCDAAGMECRGIDATPCALARFGATYRGLNDSERDVWSVLDLGARMARIVVCLGSVPISARAFNCGGRNWTEKLAQSLTVSPQTAERHKRDHGVVRDGVVRDGASAPARGAGGGASGTLGELIYNVLCADLDQLCTELERSYRYVMQCFPKHAPGPVVVVGSGGGLRGLDALLHERLGVEVIVPGVVVPERCELDLSAVGGDLLPAGGFIGEFASAIGLALPPEHAVPEGGGHG